MGPKTRLLLIGANTLREALVRALPGYDVSVAEHALDGVWRCGRQGFDGAFVSLGLGSKAFRAVSGLRQISPELRIVVSCAPPDEPLARRALEHGADDYVLEPIQPADVQAAFGVTPPKPLTEAPTFNGPSLRELVSLAEILRHLDDGPQATLDRLGTLLQQTFEAVGATIQLDQLTRTAGDAQQLVLEEIIHRDNKPVGRVALARRARGTYAAGAATRLAEYARLIETVTGEARERQRWQELAWTDDLSRLHNRRYFEQVLEQLVQRASERRLRLTILLFDIDDFKSYNDNFGHETGDKLIQEVALLLKRCTREHDVVVRYGGDEFAVVFWDAEEQRVPGSEHPREPMALANRFCNAIAQHSFECLGSGAPGPVTISGGLACFPRHGTAREQLLAAADQALLSAKRTGKNRIHLAGRTEAETNPPE